MMPGSNPEDTTLRLAPRMAAMPLLLRRTAVQTATERTQRMTAATVKMF